MVYQLDYQDRGAGEDYFQLFQDCGWEYVARFTQYYYFRKPAARMPPLWGMTRQTVPGHS